MMLHAAHAHRCDTHSGYANTGVAGATATTVAVVPPPPPAPPVAHITRQSRDRVRVVVRRSFFGHHVVMRVSTPCVFIA